MEELAKIPGELYALWLKFADLAVQSPILAAIFGIIVILFLISQGSQLASSAIITYRANRSVFFISATMVTATSIGLVIVARYQNAPVPKIIEPSPGAQIIGERVLLRWQMHDKKLQRKARLDDARYQIEIRRHGKSPEKIETFETYYSLRTTPGTFEWRVRRLTRSDKGQFRPESRWSSWQTQELYDSVIQRIKMTHEIRVAVTKDPIAPYYFFDRKRKTDRGIDREVAELVVKGIIAHLHVRQYRVDWVPRPWLAGMASSLQDHDADFAVAQTTISKKREAENRIRFSSPYLRVPQAIIFRHDRIPEMKFEDLKQYRFTAWRHTTGEALAKDLHLNVTPSSNAPELYQKLNDGEVDAIIDDYFLAAYLAQSVERGYSYSIIPIPADKIPAAYKKEFSYPDPLGIFVSETSSGLLKMINGILKEAVTKKQIAHIRREYLGKYDAQLAMGNHGRDRM